VDWLAYCSAGEIFIWVGSGRFEGFTIHAGPFILNGGWLTSIPPKVRADERQTRHVWRAATESLRVQTAIGLTLGTKKEQGHGARAMAGLPGGDGSGLRLL